MTRLPRFQAVTLSLATAFVILCLSPAADATNYPMNQTTNVLGPGSGTWTFGYRFQVAGQGVAVTELCCFVGAITSVDVKLWNDTGTQLAVATPSGSVAGWLNSTLSSPIVLTQGSYYWVSVHTTSYRYFNITGWTGDSNIVYSMHRYNSETAHTFPTQYTGSTTIWGLPDIGYILGPPAPSSITVPSVSTTGNFTVSWSSVSAATGYDLEEDTSSSFSNPTQVYSGANTSFGVTGKGPGTFYYRVRAFDSIGNSPWTAGSNGCVVQVPPFAPASVTVPSTTDTGSFTVAWSSCVGATSYTLEEDTSSGFTNPTTVYSGSSTSYAVTGKVSGSFYYRARASNSFGFSPWTAGANGCTVVPPQPPATVTVPAQSVTGAYQVSWSTSTGATSYDLEEDTSASFTAPTTVYSGATPYFDVTGKVSGTTYYRARAVNGAGASAWTAGSNGCQMVPPIPPAPVIAPTTSATGSYAVSWANSLGATNFELEEDSSGAFANPVTLYSGANTNFTVFGRANGTYWYRARAGNGAGQSAWAVTAAGTAVTLAPPPVPGTLSVPPTSNTGFFTVSWAGSTGATLYELEEAGDSTFAATTQVYAGPNAAFALAGKTDGTYWYRVRATNAAGASNWLNSANGCRVTLSAPGRPGFLTVPATSNTGTFNLVWGPVSNAVLYELEEATAADYAGAVQVYSGTATAFQVAGRAEGTYWYRVRVHNTRGTGAWRDGANPCAVTLMQASLAVEAGPANPAASLELPGSTDVPVLQLRLTAGALEGILVQSVTVHASGTGHDATDLALVVLRRDADGDGRPSGADPIVGTGAYAADDGTVFFDLSAEPSVPAGGRVHYLVSYDVRSTAASGGTFQASLTPAGDIACTVDGGTTPVAPDGAAVVGGAKTLATSGVGALSIAVGGNNPAPTTASIPSQGAPALQLVLGASSMEDVEVRRLQIASLGTGNEGAGVAARLVEDTDGDGIISSGDVQIGSEAFTTDNGTVEFTGLTLYVQAGGAATLLLAYDFGEAAAPGSYAAALLSDACVDAVGAVSGLGVAVSGAPLAGSPVTASTGVSEDGASYFMGGCAGGATTHWAGTLLLLLGGLALLASRRRVQASR